MVGGYGFFFANYLSNGMNEYNFIAPFYGFLQRIVFGKSLQEIQYLHLSALKNKKQILILGGGKGEIIHEVLKFSPNAEIHYQEASSRMLAYSKSNLTEKELMQIHFYHKTDFYFTPKFDAIITPFFLDLFEEKQLEQVVYELSGLLKPNAIWIVSDFYSSETFKHKVVYLCMKLFFKVFTGLKAKELYDFDKLLASKLSKIHYTKCTTPAVFSAVYSN